MLELGCGLGLPSLAAARAGGRVLAVDWSPAAIDLLRHNAERNEVSLEAEVVSWTEPAPVLARAPFGLVLAADVLYEQRNVPVLAALLPRLGGEVLLADPGPAAPARLPRPGRDGLGAPAGVPPALTGGPDADRGQRAAAPSRTGPRSVCNGIPPSGGGAVSPGAVRSRAAR